MTDARRAQLDMVAERFGTTKASVYLLAGEVKNAIEYVSTNEPRRQASDRQHKARRHSRVNTRNLINSGDFTLDWIDE